MRLRLTTDDVINAVRRLPDKSSAADPLPTTVLIQAIDLNDLLSQFITELFSRSPSTGRFPAGIRQSFITLIVKKPGLDAVDARFLPTDIELISVVQAPGAPGCPSADGVQSSADLLPTRQSGFRPGHSTETARPILRVLSDIC